MKQYSLITAGILTTIALVWSSLSLLKLGNIGDGDPILSPLRIINRDIIFLSSAVFLIIIYIRRKDK